jgi:MFS family permease
VNVALPAVQRDLHFSLGNLTWVINAFLVTFGSFMLLAGRRPRNLRQTRSRPA